MVKLTEPDGSHKSGPIKTMEVHMKIQIFVNLAELIPGSMK